MTRIKFAAISTITAAMILGSTLVFAAAPAADSTGTGTGADAPSITTELQADPTIRRGGGGGGRYLKN